MNSNHFHCAATVVVVSLSKKAAKERKVGAFWPTATKMQVSTLQWANGCHTGARAMNHFVRAFDGNKCAKNEHFKRKLSQLNPLKM